MSAPRPRGYAWVFAHSRFGGQRTGREDSLALASTGKDGRGKCADLPACGEALAPLRPHRLERPVAGPGGDGYAIWSLTGLAVYDRYHLWAGLDDQFHVMNPLWNGRTERATGQCHCLRFFVIDWRDEPDGGLEGGGDARMSKLARLILRRATHERTITRKGQSIGAKPKKCAARHVAGNTTRSWFDWLTMSGLRRRMEMIEGFRFTRRSWLPPPSVRVSMAQVRVRARQRR